VDKKWYVVNCHSGYEEKAKNALIDRVQKAKLADFFGDVLIPKEDVVEMKKGTKQTSSRRFFPGYMFVQMVLNENTWHIVKNTSHISGFVGNTKTPLPITEDEVNKITQQMVTGAEKPRPKFNFDLGEEIRVTDGPFSNFNGTVEEVNEDKGKLKVLVSIFGRPTPVELDFGQVEKTK
jgi:transcriptional antiterminator NusG